jgi:ABC-type antimicrobial peptide transport system permease subunit
MTLKDATTLAYTKYRTRKARSILVVFGSACITSLVLFMSIASAGLNSSVTNKATPFEEQNLLLVNASFAPDTAETTTTRTENDELKKKYLADSGVNASTVKNVYFEAVPEQPNGSSLSDLQRKEVTNEIIWARPRFVVQSQGLIDPFVQDKAKLSYKKGDPLPIVVSNDILQEAYGKEISDIKNIEQRIEKIRELQNKQLGKTQTLTLKYLPQDYVTSGNYDASSEVTKEIPVVIVGFSPSSKGFLSSIIGVNGFSIATTFEAALAHPELKDIVPTARTAYFAFETRADRDAALKKIESSTTFFGYVYGDISGSVQGLLDSVSIILRWIIIVMLLFVTLPMMSTMSKILSDSQRETGVFRAIGARNIDITTIYVVYSTILASLAFLISIVIASGIALFLSLRYGGLLGAQLSDISGSTIVTKVTMYGVNPLHWLVLFGILVVSAALGTAFPVMRTLRKDPILAMRDE